MQERAIRGRRAVTHPQAPVRSREAEGAQGGGPRVKAFEEAAVVPVQDDGRVHSGEVLRRGCPREEGGKGAGILPGRSTQQFSGGTTGDTNLTEDFPRERNFLF